MPHPNGSTMPGLSLHDEKTLDRHNSRQAPDFDEPFNLPLCQAALGVGKREIHVWVARGDQQRRAFATVRLDEDIRDLLYVPLAVSKRIAERREQCIAQPRVVSHQGLIPSYNVLDHLVES